MLRTTGLVLAMTAIALADGPGTNHGQRKQVTLWAAISTPEPVVEASNTENLEINFGVVNDGHSTLRKQGR